MTFRPLILATALMALVPAAYAQTPPSPPSTPPSPMVQQPRGGFERGDREGRFKEMEEKFYQRQAEEKRQFEANQIARAKEFEQRQIEQKQRFEAHLAEMRQRHEEMNAGSGEGWRQRPQQGNGAPPVAPAAPGGVGAGVVQ